MCIDFLTCSSHWLVHQLRYQGTGSISFHSANAKCLESKAYSLLTYGYIWGFPEMVPPVIRFERWDFNKNHPATGYSHGHGNTHFVVLGSPTMCRSCSEEVAMAMLESFVLCRYVGLLELDRIAMMIRNPYQAFLTNPEEVSESKLCQI